MHNALEALQAQPVVSPVAPAQLRQPLLHLKEQVQQLETKLLTTVEARYPPEMQLLCSIPGIGRKTAAYLLLFASGFTCFQNYRQLVAKAGLCPREFCSGTSVRGKARISKMGGGLIISKLYYVQSVRPSSERRVPRTLRLPGGQRQKRQARPNCGLQ